MKKNYFQIFLATGLLLFASCSGKEKYEMPEFVIEANAKYMNEENLEKVMGTIYKDSPAYQTSEMLIEKLFEVYDLNYKIINIKVLEDNGSEAKVEFTQVTTKIKGPEFKNNRSTGIHLLKKEGDSWKIYSTQMKDVQYI
ncbi:MAG: hypothetical protein IH620_00105 [Ignavibacterium sp.]|nr:hypothetical protein [Ignavibacterium sp.]